MELGSLPKISWTLFKNESESEVAQSCPTLCDPVDCSQALHPWASPGKNTGVGCHFLLQGIFPDPGIEPRSPALQADTLTSEPYLLSIKNSFWVLGFKFGPIDSRGAFNYIG